MSDFRKTLIALYSNNQVSDLEESSKAFKQVLGDDYKKISQSEEFRYLKETIKEEKATLERLAERYQMEHGVPLGDPKIQAIECLRLLLIRAMFKVDDDDRFKAKFDTIRDLMIEKYSHAWSENLRKHFDFLNPKIRDWELFFFSYANDDKDIQNLELDLNESFWQSNTILAELIIQYLKRNNLQRYFYDKRDIDTGKRLDTIFEKCETSFFFIQLISKDTLVFDKENWSYQEYHKFNEVNQELLEAHPEYKAILNERFLFAVPEGKPADVKPASFLPPGYDDWYTHIEDTHYKTLPNDKATFEQAVREIAKSVTTFLSNDWIRSVDP